MLSAKKVFVLEMWMLACLLITFLNIRSITARELGTVQCDSNITSQIHSTNNDDYYLNLSSISTEYNNSATLDVEFMTFPSIPIEIYFANATIYKYCIKQCYIHQIPVSQDYIIRLNKYLRNNEAINYTLSMKCYKPYITTSIYTTGIVLTEFDYSVSFNQQLTFRNRGNILSFAVSILIVLFFVTIGLYIHFDSNRPELKFLARKSNAPYYLSSLATLLTCIIMCSTSYANKQLLGALTALTMTTINFVAVIGMKYYSSFITNAKIRNSTFTLARLCRWISLFLGIVYLVFYYVAINNGLSILSTVLIITYIELILLSIASFASKTAQLQWCILFILIWWLNDSNLEEIFFDFYWYSMFCILCALCSIFLFSNKAHIKSLRSMFVKVFGAFISIFDIATDVTVMVLWIRNELYFWTIMQLVFIFSGTVYSAFYIDDYYFIDDYSMYYLFSSKQVPDEKERQITENKEKAKRLFWGRLFTLFGLGRVYHGILGWDEERNKDMEISNRILKIWELIFESFPTICLQTWISLYTDLDVNIVLSLFVGFASISFTFFRVLYGDHNADNREQEYVIAHRLHKRHTITRSDMINSQKKSSSYPNSNLSVDLVKEMQNEIEDIKQEEKEEVKEEESRTETMTLKQKTEHEVPEEFGQGRSRSDTLRKAAEKVGQSRTCRNLWRNFVCCYPVKLCVDYATKHENNDAQKETNDDKQKLTWKDKLFYLCVYIWVMTDFGIRIFPVLACARLRQQYLEFLAVMFGLTLFEFFCYYFMLSGEFKTPRSATHFFWTLYFTVSYCLLSTMHLVYLPNNVMFNRLIIEHCLRMVIQAGFMSIAMVIQYYDYGDILGFFDVSIIWFWIAWIFNVVLTLIVRKGYEKIEDKIEIRYHSAQNTPDQNDDNDEQNNIELVKSSQSKPYQE